MNYEIIIVYIFFIFCTVEFSSRALQLNFGQLERNTCLVLFTLRILDGLSIEVNKALTERFLLQMMFTCTDFKQMYILTEVFRNPFHQDLSFLMLDYTSRRTLVLRNQFKKYSKTLMLCTFYIRKQRELFYSFLEIICVILHLNSRYCCPYC